MYRVLSLREPHNGGYVILHYIIKEEFGTKTSYAQIDTQGRKMIHNEFKGRFTFKTNLIIFNPQLINLGYF
jgi:hypothetical protein